MLFSFRQGRDFFLLLRILLSLSASLFLPFCFLLCSSLPPSCPPLSSSCFPAASCTSSSSPSVRDWPFLWSVFPNFGLESSLIPFRPLRAPSSPRRTLLAAAASAQGDPVFSFSYPPSKPLLASAVVPSRALTGYPYAASTFSECSGNVSKRTRARQQSPHRSTCLKYALFPVSISPFPTTAGAPCSCQTLRATPSSISVLRRAAAAAGGSSGRRPGPAALHSVSAVAPKHQGQRSTARPTSTFETELWTASAREVHGQLISNQKEPRKRPAVPSMAASATGPAAFAAFYLDGGSFWCPRGAAGVCRTVTRRVAVAGIAAAIHGGLPAAAPGRTSGTVAAAAPLRSAYRASAATALHCSAFTTAAPSYCDACATAAAASASEWGSLTTARRPLCPRTKESSCEASSPSVVQQRRSSHRHWWHRCTRLLAQKLAGVLDWRKGWISRQQQGSSLPRLQPISCVSHSGCFRAAAGSRPPEPRKHTRVAIYRKTAIAKAADEAAGFKDTATAIAGRPYTTALSPRAYAGRSPAADAAEADTKAAAAAEKELQSQQPPQQHGGRQHSRRFTHTKQVATIGPASWTYEEIERLFLSGVDVFRLNLSHGLLHEKHQQLQHVRRVERKYGHPIAVLADLPGPKLRLGSFEGDDTVFLPAGATFIIDNAAAVLGNQQRVALPQHTEVLQALRAGDVLLLDDGKLKLQVVRQLNCSRETYQQRLRERSRRPSQQEEQQQGNAQQEQQYGQGEDKFHELQQHQRTEQLPQSFSSRSSFPDRVTGVECVVSVGGPLSGKKGVNIPAAALPLSALSARDRELARLVAGWGVDWIALSFVQRAEDVRELRKELRAHVELLAKDTAGTCDSSSTSNSSSRTLNSSTGSETALRQSGSTSEAGEQSVYDKEQSVQRPPTQKQQPHREQQENGDKETEMEQQRRLRGPLVNPLEGSFSAFASSHVQRGGGIAVIVKIEKPLALENIEEILEEADGLMVARGDLGVELAEHAAWLPVVQKRLVKLCQEAGKPVVIATQMLDSMTHAPAPTRAELTDVANAVYDGADAVMLSGETAAGAAPAHVAKTQLQGIRAVEGDPHFWRLQSVTRRLLVDKEVARIASCCGAETRTSSSQMTSSGRMSSHGVSDRSAAAHLDDWESHGATSGRGEEHDATVRAAAGNRNASVGARGNVQAGAREVAEEGLRQSSGENREKIGKKEQQIEQGLQETEELAPSAGEHERLLDSNLRARRGTRQRRLFPELKGGQLPWNRQLTRISDAQLGEQNAEDLAAAARRAAAVAAASFVGGESWVGTGHNSTKDSRGRSSRISTDMRASQRTCTSAANKENIGEVGDARWVAAAAEQASRVSGATSIVIFEETGQIARHLAALRPVVPVVAVTPSAHVARELQLHWGIYPVVDPTVWEAPEDTSEEEKGVTGGKGGRRSTGNEEKETSETIGTAEAASENVRIRTRAEDTPETRQEKVEKGGETINMQMSEKFWRDFGPSFGTQMSKAATLLVGEGMADANADEKAVVVGGFYIRKREGAETTERHQVASNFFPQISVCRIRAFL